MICNLIFIGETIEGEDFAMKGRYSAMLEKNDGKWLMRHGHCSVPDYDVSEGESFPGNWSKIISLIYEEKKSMRIYRGWWNFSRHSFVMAGERG